MVFDIFLKILIRELWSVKRHFKVQKSWRFEIMLHTLVCCFMDISVSYLFNYTIFSIFLWFIAN